MRCQAQSSWKTVPEPLRHDPAALQEYCQCLGALVDFLDRFRHIPEVWQQLRGTAEDNPIIQSLKKLQQAEALMDELRFADIIPLLSEALNQAQHWQDVQGNVIAANVPLMHGHLGVSYFQTGEAEKAVGPLAKALELCLRYGDAQGTVVHMATCLRPIVTSDRLSLQQLMRNDSQKRWPRTGKCRTWGCRT
jgi:hypothetical protein